MRANARGRTGIGWGGRGKKLDEFNAIESTQIISRQCSTLRKPTLSTTAKGALGSSSCAPNSEHKHESRKRKKSRAGVRGLAPAPFGEWSGTANDYPATSQTIPGLNLISTLLVSQSGLIVIAVRGCHHTARHTVQSPFHVRFISRARTHPRRTRRRHAKMPSIPAYRRRPQ